LDLNKKVLEANIPLKNARIARDQALYEDEESIVKVAQKIKKYVKSVPSISPEEYAQISGIRFTSKIK
jgi:hypothetical protein